ncbi:MAG: cation-translocating P-type ATPase [Parachlamydiaceae bacterium]|nr:cation-translocating P-type ATPase [Parachlamydiaceae bacterium]
MKHSHTAHHSHSHGSENSPHVFEEFFDLGLEGMASPFLTPAARLWGKNLTVKASIVAAILLAVSFLLQFNPSMLPLSHLLLMFVYFLAGIPALIESFEDLAALDINIDILMTLAAFSSLLIGSGMEGGLLLVLFALSGAMEDAVTSKAKSAINSLHKLAPSKAFVMTEDGSLLEKSLKDISVGTTILVKAGEIVPLDGKVISGTSSVNLVHMTGENMPITTKVGDTVPAGGQNLEGALVMTVVNTSGNSALARIIQLVTEAQESRPKVQRWFEKLSRRYAMTVIFLSFCFAALLPSILGIPLFGIEGSIYRALAFLIAASPCALIIAIPIAYLSAISVCAKRGILLKGGITLDALASCKAIAFDKTGTLTQGELTYEGIKTLGNDSQESVQHALAIAYALEKNAVHPIAKAILKHCDQLPNLPSIPLKDFKSIPGYGLEAMAPHSSGEEMVFIGNPEYIISKIPTSQAEILSHEIKVFQEAGELITVLLVKTDLFILRFHDALRPKMKETIANLKKRGWNVVMLTGDHENSARRIAHEVGIDDYRSDLKPEDKLNSISALAQEHPLAMVGDGINDAPALARATVGICMGKVGSMSAVEAADVILLNDNIELLDWLIGKAHKTSAIVKENLFLAAGAILFATIPALAGLVPLWLAVVIHEGGTVLVGLNALRLLRK